MPELAIYLGGSYRSREGKVSTITGKFDPNTQLYAIGFRFIGGMCGQYFTEQGKTYLDGSDNPGDLIEEVIDESAIFTQAVVILETHLGVDKNDAYEYIRTNAVVNKIYQCAINALAEQITKRLGKWEDTTNAYVRGR